MGNLITADQLAARFTAWGLQLPDDPTSLIEDVSALVNHVAEVDFDDPPPGVIVSVVAQMIRRTVDNPGELTGEQVGSYGWQNQHAGSPSGGGIYVTRAERRLIREAAKRPSARTISGDTGLTGVGFFGVDIDDVDLDP